MNADLHSIVAGAVARAQQGALRSAQAVGFDFESEYGEQEKTASAVEANQDDQSEYREKLASALDELADMFIEKTAAKPVGSKKTLPPTSKSTVKGKTHFVSPGKSLPQSGLKAPKGGGKNAIKTASAAGDLRSQIREKLANMNGDDCNITQTPLRGGGSESLGGTGPGTRAPGSQLLASNERAMNISPEEARAYSLAGLKAYLTEPATTRANNPVLRESFQNASKAGVKIAELSVKDQIRNALIGGS